MENAFVCVRAFAAGYAGSTPRTLVCVCVCVRVCTSADSLEGTPHAYYRRPQGLERSAYNMVVNVFQRRASSSSSSSSPPSSIYVCIS